ncbi:MAG: ATP-binding protein [Elusimicrobia bacterium]|nr:ATP-binding protein [Elusimicrobiota bacterium]
MPKINPTTIRDIFQTSKLPSVHQLLNLWAVEDEAIVGLDLQMTFAYEIILPDLTVKSDEELKDYFQMIKNCLHSLPDNTTLQFLVKITKGAEEKIKEYQDTTHPADDVAKLIVDNKLEHLRSVFTQTRRYFMFLTTTSTNNDTKKLKTPMFSIINDNFKKITQGIHDVRIEKLKEISRSIISLLNGIGIPTIILDEKAISDLFYNHLNPGRAETLGLGKIDKEKTLRSQICFNACKNEFDHVYIDGYYYRAVNLHIRPETIDFSMFYRLMSCLSPDCDVSVALNTSNQDDLIKQVQLTGTIAKNINQLSGFKKNYEAQSKSDEADQLIDEIKTTFQKLFNYSFTVVLKERTLEKLTAKTNACLQLFRLLGESEGIIDDMNHLLLFLSVLPNHSHLNFKKHVFQSEAVSQMIPTSASWTGSKEPKILFQTEDDQLLPINLFDPLLPAKHGLVLGQTGGGKSFTTNFLLTNFFIESEKNHIVIIDVGGSYRKLCKLFGGQYLEIELSEEFAFNPFPSKEMAIIKRKDTEAGIEIELDNDVVSFLTNLIQKMLKLPSLEGKEQKIFENAITETYKHSKMDPPLLNSLHYQLLNYKGDESDKKIAKEYGKNLEFWTTGRYGRLLNRPSSLKADARIVVFDLQKLNEEPDLQSVIFFLISSVIENKLKDKTLKKMIVIDEGWKFFNDEVGSLLIQNLYRTARKFNAGILSISQSPVDFLSTKAANAIISNSFIKYILRLKTGFDLLTQFELNQQEIEKVKNLRSESGKYKEVFLKFSEHNRVIKIHPSKLDYWICTTDPNDTMTENIMREKHPDWSDWQIIKGLAGIK